MSRKSFFSYCPRCNHRSFEHLRTYSHCVNCFHIHDKLVTSSAIPDWAMGEYKKISKQFDYQFDRINGASK